MRMTEEQVAAHQARVRNASASTARAPSASLATPSPPKRPKYLNVKTTDLQGVVHDSKGEHTRWQELQLRERAGEITELRRQVKLELIPAQRIDGEIVERAVYWKADFFYKERGEEVWEDKKGFRTAAYILKRKMALYLRGVRIRET